MVKIQSEIFKWYWANQDTQVSTSHNSINVYHRQTLFPQTCSADWDFPKRCRAEGETALPQVQNTRQYVIKEKDLTDPIQSVYCSIIGDFTWWHPHQYIVTNNNRVIMSRWQSCWVNLPWAHDDAHPFVSRLGISILACWVMKTEMKYTYNGKVCEPHACYTHKLVTCVSCVLAIIPRGGVTTGISVSA
jgi:hypothetical protein